MRSFLCLLLLLYTFSSCHNLQLQDTNVSFQEELGIESSDSIIYFKNRSFEKGRHGHSTLPNDWFHCIDENSPSDLHHSTSAYFELKKNAIDGDQFVGMVVREDKTFENISQFLPLALQKGTTYEMEFSLAQAYKLMSASRVRNNIVNFNIPVILQVWGGFNYCESNQLLYETTKIDHWEWRNYKAKFTVEDNYEVITFEAYYSDDYTIPYNGHLLLDNISPIVRVSE